MIKATGEVQKNLWYGWLSNAAMRLNTIKGSADCSDEDKENITKVIRELQEIASNLEANPKQSHSRIRPATDLKDTEEFLESVKEYFKKSA
jgi:hypothetical protein